jgi:DHA1 family inner membrane transport protein
VTKVSPHGVTLMLLLFGAGLTLGNAIGGRLGDWKLMPSLIVAFALLIAVQFVFQAGATALIPAAIALFAWGILTFVIVPLVQMQVLHAASGAPNLASTLNQSAFNLGNATGAWLGGAALERGVSYGQLPFVGAAVLVFGLGLVILTAWQDRRARRVLAAPPSVTPAVTPSLAVPCAAE